MRSIFVSILLSLLLLTSCQEQRPSSEQMALYVLSFYAQNQTTAPTLQDYYDAGIKGVNAQNIDRINALLKKFGELNANNRALFEKRIELLLKGKLLESSYTQLIEFEKVMELNASDENVTLNRDSNESNTTAVDENSSMEHNQSKTTPGENTISNPNESNTKSSEESKSSPTTVDETPLVTLRGEAFMVLEALVDSYIELGVDVADSNVTVIQSGEVNSSKIGRYSIVYRASDSSGNEAQLERIVEVVDTTKPTLLLNGESTLSLLQGMLYQERGATAMDRVDGECNVTVEGSVDTTKSGSYTIHYYASDQSGNRASLSRSVIVYAPLPPTNQTPSVDAGVNQSAFVGQSVTLSATASDSDGTIKTYQWRQGATLLATTPSFSYTVTSEGDLSISVMVTDDGGATARDTLVVTGLKREPTLSTTPMDIDENATIGTVVDSVTIITEGNSSIENFELNDTSNFEINSSGTVTTKILLDYKQRSSYSLQARAQNSAGWSEWVSVTIGVNDTTPPTVKITTTHSGTLGVSLQSQEWVAQSIVYTLEFSEEVVGFESDDISIGNGSIEEFNGSVANYTVEVKPLLHSKLPLGITIVQGATSDPSGNPNEANSSTYSDINTGKPFITYWDTTQEGDSGSKQIKIGTNSNYSYFYTVEWGDGKSDVNVTGDMVHTYDSEGNYTVTISSDFPALYFGESGYDNGKLSLVKRWGTQPWKSMYRAFYQCKNMGLDNIDNPNLSQTQSMEEMFAGASQFSVYIGTWNTSNITNMRAMFKDATIFNQYIGDWNTSNVTDMSQMFYNAKLLTYYIGGWNTSNVTDMSEMFYGALAYNAYIGGWDTSSVTTMESMFEKATSYNQYMGDWDTSNVTTMKRMFFGATAFNYYIGGWDTSSVTTFESMFEEATNYSQYIGGWDTSNVTTMARMFLGASRYNVYIGGWDTSNVTTMESMFEGASGYHQYIGDWDTSSVVTMKRMFYGASRYNYYIGGWDTSSVRTMESMFEGASSYNQYIGNWDVSNVTNMYRMLYGAKPFNQYIAKLDVSSATDMEDMLFDTSLSTFNYNEMLQTWKNKALQHNVKFGVGDTQYSATSSRQSIIDNFSWIISDGGEAP